GVVVVGTVPCRHCRVDRGTDSAGALGASPVAGETVDGWWRGDIPAAGSRRAGTAAGLSPPLRPARHGPPARGRGGGCVLLPEALGFGHVLPAPRRGRRVRRGGARHADGRTTGPRPRPGLREDAPPGGTAGGAAGLIGADCLRPARYDADHCAD